MSLLIYCIAAVLFAFVLGRAKRSAKLFWALITSFGIGAIGAAIFSSCEDAKETTDVEKNALTSMNAGVQPATIQLMDILQAYIAQQELSSMGQEQSDRDSNIQSVSLTASSSKSNLDLQFVNLLNPEIPFEYFDTS